MNYDCCLLVGNRCNLKWFYVSAFSLALFIKKGLPGK